MEDKKHEETLIINKETEKVMKSFTGITWPSASWEDGSRRSAFQPYKSATVLTNLQRGNIQAKTPQLDVTGFSWHEKSGRGNITLKDIRNVHDINVVDKNGLTALMWSSAYGQNATVSLLLQEGADVYIKGNKLETALHFAAAGGHHDIVKQLISNGADINILDEDGYPPLIYAINGNHSHAAHELLQSGALLFEPNCYSFALSKGYSQVKSVLENHIINLLQEMS
ncbi:ankyrin repeat family A protein 2 [Halyomorpha halys]|uniref:ankyrin repeat family A protein 2 n=1 Tax=Halyomorpha halys TaxID=286706 RepID=UPI0006D4CA69|nr:ankyrin repeat family A protein 2-like [Halyomorpha halys]XP_014276220.1 ankyrin repeat family A protein 2-like [Halyomorpha halys]XP_014276221.1 ankyrin repeat family A protein 2-like [Halyomorpha halys]